MRIFLPALLLVPAAAMAQRNLDLTGKPLGSIREPFTSISGVQELTGSLAVATDNMEAKVVLLDFGRGSVRQIGAKGQGPNEYQFPSEPIRAPNGAWIFDTYQRRGIMIGANGAPISMKVLPEGALSRVRGSDDAGRVYFEGSDFDPNTGRFSDSLPVTRWDPATDRVERVVRVYGGGRVLIKRGANTASLAREITPFPHLDSWAPLPDGRVVLLRHEPFRIDVAAVGGSISTVATISSPTVPISAADREWYRERHTPGRMTAGMIGGGSGPHVAGQQWEDAHFPLTMPAFIGTDVRATPDGEIWVPRSFTSRDKVRRYDIYDATGRLTGAASVDINARVVGFGTRTVYVARTNPDDDLVYLMKYAR